MNKVRLSAPPKAPLVRRGTGIGMLAICPPSGIKRATVDPSQSADQTQPSASTATPSGTAGLGMWAKSRWQAMVSVSGLKSKAQITRRMLSV